MSNKLTEAEAQVGAYPDIMTNVNYAYEINKLKEFQRRLKLAKRERAKNGVAMPSDNEIRILQSEIYQAELISDQDRATILKERYRSIMEEQRLIPALEAAVSAQRLRVKETHAELLPALEKQVRSAQKAIIDDTKAALDQLLDASKRHKELLESNRRPHFADSTERNIVNVIYLLFREPMDLEQNIKAWAKQVKDAGY